MNRHPQRRKVGPGCAAILICDWENSTLLTDDGAHTYDNTRPSISPSGMMVAFVSNRPVPGTSESADDYEVWRMSAIQVNTAMSHLTDNSDIEDDEPDWGGAATH